tara:strand:- start:14673 stop:14825 length:153 start_codon:yes stop_codon:yes gene_type:complete
MDVNKTISKIFIITKALKNKKNKHLINQLNTLIEDLKNDYKIKDAYGKDY